MVYIVKSSGRVEGTDEQPADEEQQSSERDANSDATTGGKSASRKTGDGASSIAATTTAVPVLTVGASAKCMGRQETPAHSTPWMDGFWQHLSSGTATITKTTITTTTEAAAAERN